MRNTKITGLALISFVFAIAGVIVSALLLREDVTSTAQTLLNYFPERYGVTPSSTWEGALILGLFTSILQVIAANVAFSNKFSNTARGVAAISLISSVVFDNWTDVVFRSGNLTGDIRVAYATTFAFYTAGSEVTQALSWLVIVGTWRAAISDFMYGAARFGAGFSSIRSEWQNFKRAARNQENRNNTPGNDNKNPYTPSFPSQSNQNQNKPHVFKPYGNQPPRSDTKTRKPD